MRDDFPSTCGVMIKVLGHYLVMAGICLFILGLLLQMGARLKWLGRLPGDIIIHKGSFTFYFPLATSLVSRLINTFPKSCDKTGHFHGGVKLPPRRFATLR